ncbi:uncharacterized protein CCOS01_03773 [Colletotrichum costaricense]|uniref:Uncharacterized protein n=1 Tax=Colletotrichum costaricense TaxID=1209916 RepID=A0AAI9Z787_9PEZI|nr:uncharacterized protein CCOS01_03773 [Colletotrichum costaricense]KAK1535021.1 hypothetical protein CCOS01_03773 [Colletotrichum costaricense]
MSVSGRDGTTESHIPLAQWHVNVQSAACAVFSESTLVEIEGATAPRAMISNNQPDAHQSYLYTCELVVVETRD